jgi:hypothetical protein
MGANEATPADRASGAGAGNGATPPVVDWTDAALALAPTRVGGYEETPVGRLPTGPAGDAALAAVRARPAAPRALPPRPAEDVLDLGELSRGAVLKRVVPVVVVIAAAVGALVALRVRRRRAR